VTATGKANKPRFIHPIFAAHSVEPNSAPASID